MNRILGLAAGAMAILAASGGACSGGHNGAATATATAVASDTARTSMKLRIRLRDGVRGQSVAIAIDGKEIYRKSGVTTDLSISYADAVEASTGATPVMLAVSVSDGPAASKEIDPRHTPFVDVWIVDGRMELRGSDTEPPML